MVVLNGRIVTETGVAHPDKFSSSRWDTQKGSLETWKTGRRTCCMSTPGAMRPPGDL